MIRIGRKQYDNRLHDGRLRFVSHRAFELAKERQRALRQINCRCDGRRAGKVQTQTGMDKFSFVQKLHKADPEHLSTERYITYEDYFSTEYTFLADRVNEDDSVYLYISNQWYLIPYLKKDLILQQDPIEINGLD